MNNTPVTEDSWQLVHKDTGLIVRVGETVRSFRGEEATINGGIPPRSVASTGRVSTTHGLFYPSVYGLMWVDTADH